MSANITITRKKNMYGFLRSMNIKLNGVDCGYLKSGKSISFEKETGQYELIVQVEVYKSSPYIINLKENDSQEIIVSNSQKSDTMLFVFMIGLIGTMVFDLIGFKIPYLNFFRYAILSLPIIQILYFFTIKKGQFFSIHENKL
jgi:hypothetical protein